MLFFLCYCSLGLSIWNLFILGGKQQNGDMIISLQKGETMFHNFARLVAHAGLEIINLEQGITSEIRLGCYRRQGSCLLLSSLRFQAQSREP